MNDDPERSEHQRMTEGRLRTPRAAAVAGIVFAILLIVSMALLQTAMPTDPSSDVRWLTDHDTQVSIAVTLVPFGAIAFLWFMGVLRDLLGRREDQFFGTVFFGSGLLLLGAMFVWVGAIAAAIASANASPDVFADSSAFVFAGSFIKVMGRDVMLRMAGVFMLSAATMWMQTRLVPRWLVVVTYIGAVILLVGGPELGPVRMAFPLWVLTVSAVILVIARRAGHAAVSAGAPPPP